MMKDPKNVVVSGTIGLVGLLFIGIFILIALGRDTEQITTFALIVIPLVIGLGGVGALQADNSKKIENVGKNVNGNMTALLKLVDKAIAEGVITERDLASDELASADTIERIRGDVDKLPKH